MDLNQTNIISGLINERDELKKEIGKLREDKKKIMSELKKYEIKTSRKDFFSSSKKTKSRLRNDIKRVLIEMNKKLKLANLTVKSIKILESNNKKYED